MSGAWERVPPNHEGGGLLNLVASLEEALGGRPQAPPATALPPVALRGAEAVVLLLVDGLGLELLQRRGGPLLEALRAPLTSVCPATTASAVTTCLTGEPPGRHGLTGWFVWLRELGAVTAVLPWRPRAAGPAWSPGAWPEAGTVLRLRPLAARLPGPACLVTEAPLVATPYSRAAAAGWHPFPYQGLEGLVARTVEAVETSLPPGPRLVHAYWPELDRLQHRLGPDHPEVAGHLQALEEAVLELAARLRARGVPLLVIADHGLVPVERSLELERHPELRALLRLPLCGEPRLAYCYVRPGRERAFEAYVAGRLGTCCRLHRAEELVAAGWYGPPPHHPELAERLGDYVLEAAPGWVLRDRLPGEEAHPLRGAHGGLSPAEMRIPLLAFL